MKQYQVTVRKVDEFGRRVEEQIPIDDGNWTVTVHSAFTEEVEYEPDDFFSPGFSHTGRHFFLTVGAQVTNKIVLDSSGTSKSYSNGRYFSRYTYSQLVSDRPFGAIQGHEDDGQRVSGLHFSCARQVHKGELGRRPIIPRPRFAREAPRPMDEVSLLTGKPIKKRNKRRGKIGWARLTEVAELAQLETQALVRRYFPFSDAEHPALQVLMAEHHEQIHGQPVPYNSWETFHLVDLPALFDRPLGHIWVRKGWTMVVLHLQALGYDPDKHR